MSLTIWYVSKYIAFPWAGKSGTRAFMLMRELTRGGDTCVMITSDANHLTDAPEFAGKEHREIHDGVLVCWLKTRKYRGAQSLGRILSWLSFERRLWRMPKSDLPTPDVIVVSSLSLLTILNGILLRQHFGCRLIFEVRDIWPLTLTEEGGFDPGNPFVRVLGWIERLGYRQADAIVGTMPNLAEHVREVSGRNEGVFTIPFGIDQEMVEDVLPLPLGWAEAHIAADRFVVCHAGTIGTTNALDTLFACARIMQNEPVQFLIVGDGDLRVRYQEHCRDLVNVIFTGRVPKPMVQTVVGACDLAYFAALPSRVWRYGMSLNKVVDYMLAARPVLGSYTGFRTMIEDAGCGTMVPAQDVGALRAEILRYAAMPAADRAAIGAKGRKWLLENRSYATLARQYRMIMSCEALRPRLQPDGNDGFR